MEKNITYHSQPTLVGKPGRSSSRSFLNLCMMSEVGAHLIAQPGMWAVWFHPVWMQRGDRSASAHAAATWLWSYFPSQHPRIDFPLLHPSKLSPAVSGPHSSWSSPVDRTAHILALPLVGLERFLAGTMSWINVRISLSSS